MARMVATKAALSIRVDALADVDEKSEATAASIGIENRARLEARLRALENQADLSTLPFANSKVHQQSKFSMTPAKQYNAAADSVGADKMDLDQIPAERMEEDMDQIPAEVVSKKTKKDKKEKKEKEKKEKKEKKRAKAKQVADGEAGEAAAPDPEAADVSVTVAEEDASIPTTSDGKEKKKHKKRRVDGEEAPEKKVGLHNFTMVFMQAYNVFLSRKRRQHDHSMCCLSMLSFPYFTYIVQVKLPSELCMQNHIRVDY